MAKGIKAGQPPSSIRNIRAGDLVPGGLVRFSFKYLDCNHGEYHAKDCDAGYFLTLLGRLRDLSGATMESLRASKANSATRFHQIDFRDIRVSADGFGIPQCDQFDGEAWQFAVSSNEHGRIHGFVIEDTFFVVWLDPDHRLYPG